MQISKAFLVVCTAVCCASSVSLAAPDTAAQAQAREALRKKMAELSEQEPAPTESMPNKPKVETVEAAPAPAPQPVVQPPPAAVAPAPPPAEPVTFVTAPITSMSDEEANRLREAVRQKIAELDAQAGTVQPAPPTVQPPPAAPAQPQKTKATAKTFDFAPLASPPTAVPASKEAKLDDLLRKYKADQITAEEYHNSRAKILAEP